MISISFKENPDTFDLDETTDCATLDAGIFLETCFFARFFFKVDNTDLFECGLANGRAFNLDLPILDVAIICYQHVKDLKKSKNETYCLPGYSYLFMELNGNTVKLRAEGNTATCDYAELVAAFKKFRKEVVDLFNQKCPDIKKNEYINNDLFENV